MNKMLRENWVGMIIFTIAFGNISIASYAFLSGQIIQETKIERHYYCNEVIKNKKDK